MQTKLLIILAAVETVAANVYYYDHPYQGTYYDSDRRPPNVAGIFMILPCLCILICMLALCRHHGSAGVGMDQGHL